MSVTIKDVAKLAGVSISTVSRVINDSKPVSPEIKQKVLEVIEEVGYKPNEIARTLVTKKSYLIGVIVTDLGNTYVAEMVRGLEEIGKMYNYDILLCSTYGDPAAEIKYLQLLNRKQVEGIVLISDELRGDIKEQIKAYQKPFVFLSRYDYSEEFATVSIDNHDAAFEMTNYLQSLGHRHIAYVSFSGQFNEIEKVKINGYKKAMEEEGEETVEEKIYYGEGHKIRHGYDIAKDIAKDLDELTAIFCTNDEMAIGISNYFYDHNIKIPEDVSLVGFGDLQIASVVRPKLTTIKQPFYDIGAVAIRRIIKDLKEEKVEEKDIKLPFAIQKRDSCTKLKY